VKNQGFLSVTLQLSHASNGEICFLNVKLWDQGFRISFEARLARFLALW
jgi:hypothetical protein